MKSNLLLNIFKSRIFYLFLFLLSLLLIVLFTPLGSYLTVENIEKMVEISGHWGVIMFISIFVLAAIMNVPGTAFLILSIFLFGYTLGPVYSYTAAMIGASITFYIGRKIGGNAIEKLNHPIGIKILKLLDNKPVLALILLRIFLQFSPIIGYSLAMTNIKTRSYIIGNFIGFLFPTLYISTGLYFFEDTIRLLFY